MRFDRLRQLTAEELRWRVGDKWRTAAERLSTRVRPPRWGRREVLEALSPDALDGDLRGAITSQRWDEANTLIADRLAGRPARYVLDPAAAPAIRRRVLEEWPRAAEEAGRDADRILGGRYDLLGYRDLSFSPGGAPDWHFDPVHQRRAPHDFWADVPYLDPAIGDHKIIWELNRHQHWMRLGRAFWLTGNRAYPSRIIRELESWLATNPPLVGINWASMLEVGFRSLSWTWVANCLIGNPGSGVGVRESTAEYRDPQSFPTPWLIDLLVGLNRQLTHVERHLSYYFSPNTHLTGEALALYVAGTAFPELARSGRWADVGRRILLSEINRQILGDGGHAERSTHYQRYTLDFYLLALLTARRSGDCDAEAMFADAARRLAEFTRTVADDSGCLPLIGDDDGGMLWPLTGRACNDVRDSLSLAAAILDRPDLAPWGLTEEAIWIGGAGLANVPPASIDRQPRTIPAAILLADSGYFVARNGSGGHAVMDVGAHGYMNAGHAHADALAVTLSVNGRPLLIDPGTSSYTVDPRIRDRMRHTASHNTVTVDGRPQSVPRGPFHWSTQAEARAQAWGCDEHTAWVEGTHDGYDDAPHRRTFLSTADDGWLIVDDILGTTQHLAAAHWHFDPAWRVEESAPGALRLEHDDGDLVWLLHDADTVTLHYGDDEAGLGWYAPVYGSLVPTWSARITRSAAAPFAIATWIGVSGVRPSMRCRLDDAASSMTIEIAGEDRRSTFLLRPGQGTAPRLHAGSVVGKTFPLARV